MSKQLNVPSNADEPTPETPVANELELTPREIAIAEGRDPDEPAEVAETEVVVADEPEVEQPAGEVADSEVSDPPADTPAGPWYSNYDRQYAEHHGLSEWHLQQFESRDEFRKAAALLDATSSRRQEPKPEPVKPQAEAPAEYVDKPIVDGKLNVEFYRKNGYDEPTIAALQYQQERLTSFEQRFADQEKKAAEQQQYAQQAEEERQYAAFNQAADSIRPDFYGKSVDDYGNPVRLTPEQQQRRDTLLDEVYWLTQRIAYEQERKGMRVAIPSYNALIKQAEPRAFGEELKRLDSGKKASAAQAQARTIRPAAGSVGAGSARRAPTTPASESVADIAHDPEVIEAWNRASPQNR